MVICQALGIKLTAATRCYLLKELLSATEISIATSWGARDKRLPGRRHLLGRAGRQEQVGTEHPKMDRGEEGAGGSAPVPSRSHPRLQVPALNPAPKDEKLMLTFP